MKFCAILELYTDTSDYFLCAVLDKNNRPTAFFSIGVHYYGEDFVRREHYIVYQPQEPGRKCFFLVGDQEVRWRLVIEKDKPENITGRINTVADSIRRLCMDPDAIKRQDMDQTYTVCMNFLQD